MITFAEDREFALESIATIHEQLELIEVCLNESVDNRHILSLLDEARDIMDSIENKVDPPC